MKSFSIGSHTVSNQNYPLFLPDIGTFFNQDISLAISMIDALQKAGIKTIKGEILHTADICLAGDHTERYLSSDQKTIISENYLKLIQRKILSLNDYRKIFDYCHKQKMDIVVSVYDDEGAFFAKEHGAVALKVSSSNITHNPLINSIAALELPIIIDTGYSTIAEAVRAVEWCRSSNENRIIVQHSPPAPPAGVEEHNLNLMLNFGSCCNTFYGLSDHHSGPEMLITASALGAVIIEKGVYPRGKTDEQDLSHALCIDDVETAHKAIQSAHAALGTGNDRDLTDTPQYISRMCLVAKCDLSFNDTISLENVTFAFPPLGIGCEHWPEVVGKKIIKAVNKGSVVSWQDIDI
mgnify:CR=1 FL=1|tara:strand:+ start:3649 stop:4701 length:1053 start_codon:yes stop_codon:yes gene_type:complete